MLPFISFPMPTTVSSVMFAVSTTAFEAAAAGGSLLISFVGATPMSFILPIVSPKTFFSSWSLGVIHDGHGLAAPSDIEFHGAHVGARDRLLEVAPLVDLLPVDADDDVAGLEAGDVGGLARHHLPYFRGRRGNGVTGEEDDEEDEQRRRGR